MMDVPVIMSAPMVQAGMREAQDPGTGKTNTRRFAWGPHFQKAIDDEGGYPGWRWGSWRPGECAWPSAKALTKHALPPDTKMLIGHMAPSGWQKIKTGDRLWVRENLKCTGSGIWRYAADRLPPEMARRWVGFDSMSVLRRISTARLHWKHPYEVVMEDSQRELSKHLPIFLRASGRVLVTGLGLGCVVRGLLANKSVYRIDVVEIDSGILRVIGPEFVGNPRVTLHHGDALKIDLPGNWDFAWHDLHVMDGEAGKLFMRFADRCGWQGAWHFPGNLARRLPWNQEAA